MTSSWNVGLGQQLGYMLVSKLSVSSHLMSVSSISSMLMQSCRINTQQQVASLHSDHHGQRDIDKSQLLNGVWGVVFCDLPAAENSLVWSNIRSFRILLESYETEVQHRTSPGLREVCILILRASVGTLFVHQSRHQLSPELDCVSHKKAESWAGGHGGILWTQLTRTSGHTSSCYTSYFCPIKAAPISFKRTLSLMWSLLPFS